ncbi:hypothetical protein HAX54_001133 [Datura stramonium]|uniref:Uncharacterized protein n=1 Tax=Datura stramonium TaxID=4076 RepID=A0ABS8RSG3_DATST|nr:hypothetical protein [Datura stramonium]
MPQVDLETLVSACAGGGSDRKVACETLADRDGEKPVKDDLDEEEKQPELPPDFPPESFWLSKDAEFDWFDRNAFLDRKQSTKGIGPNTTNLNPGSNSSSQRFSSTLKSKASIIGFPKTQKASYVDSKRRTCKPANIRLFPAKRSESTLKAASVTEPSSPKVSCMGRVRSKRRSRRSSEKSKKCEKKSLERSRSSSGEKRKTGFCSRLLSIFRSSRSNKKPARSSTDKVLGSRVEEPVKPMRKSKSVSIGKTRGAPVGVEPVFSEPVGLGGMKRFSSGRRSESWGGDEINAVV